MVVCVDCILKLTEITSVESDLVVYLISTVFGNAHVCGLHIDKWQMRLLTSANMLSTVKDFLANCHLRESFHDFKDVLHF